MLILLNSTSFNGVEEKQYNKVGERKIEEGEERQNYNYDSEIEMILRTAISSTNHDWCIRHMVHWNIPWHWWNQESNFYNMNHKKGKILKNTYKIGIILQEN